MDSSDNSRSSKIPIEATVTSNGEPLVVSGGFTPCGDGFVLDFAVGDGKYTVEHSVACTRLVAAGLMSYAVDFTDGSSSSVIKTPFGDMPAKVTASSRSVEVGNGGVEIALEYSLEISGEVTDRAVKISARFV